MKVVVQRAKNASVTVANEVIGEIDHGLVVLLGVTHGDTIKDVEYLVNKIIHLRIFEDEDNKMNLSLKDVGGSVLSISQFTLYADMSKGRRPSFTDAASPDTANELYMAFNDCLLEADIPVETGEFGAMMDIKLTNIGPVTLVIDSKT